MSPKRHEDGGAAATGGAIARVWRADLDDPGWDRFACVLRADEVDKAARYRTARLAAHYRRCRTILRLLLAADAGLDPARIAFRYGWAGKPEAVDLPGHFNVSHAAGRALIALSPHPVGIDIESTAHDRIRMEELADLVCHPDELAMLAGLAPASRQDVLYRLWVRKEAYCKALGTGLQSDLCGIRFAPTATSGIAGVRDAVRAHAKTHYVHCWDEPDGHVASLCLPLEYSEITVESVAPRKYCR